MRNDRKQQLKSQRRSGDGPRARHAAADWIKIKSRMLTEGLSLGCVNTLLLIWADRSWESIIREVLEEISIVFLKQIHLRSICHHHQPASWWRLAPPLSCDRLKALRIWSFLNSPVNSPVCFYHYRQNWICWPPKSASNLIVMAFFM